MSAIDHEKLDERALEVAAKRSYEHEGDRKGVWYIGWDDEPDAVRDEWIGCVREPIQAYLYATLPEDVAGVVERLRGELPVKQVGRGRHGDRIMDLDFAAIERERYEVASLLTAQAAELAAVKRERDEANALVKQAAKTRRTMNDAMVELTARADRAEAELAAVKVERDEARRYAGMGCDANDGGAHSIIKQGSYKFCKDCGYTIETPTLTERCRAAEARAERLRAALAEKDKALEPFARAADAYDPDEGDGDLPVWDTDFTVGHLRTARKAMGGDGNG